MSAPKKVWLTRPERRTEARGEEKVSNPSPSHTHASAGTHAPTPLPLGGGGATRAGAGLTSAREAAVDDVVDQFRLLAPADRKRALALMSLEVQNASGRSSPDLELWAGAVHEALEDALGPSDGGGHGPQVVRRILGLPANWGPVEEFFAASGLADLQHANERLKAFQTIAQLVVANARGTARHVGIPLGPKLVANTAHNVAGIFDNAFPGYVRAGMAHLVVRAMGEKK